MLVTHVTVLVYYSGGLVVTLKITLCVIDCDGGEH